MTTEYEAPLREGNLNTLLRAFKDQLSNRSPLWVKKLGDLIGCLNNAIKAFNENKFQNFREVLPIAEGDNICLLGFMNSAVKLPGGTKVEEMKSLEEFCYMNSDIDDVQNF